jgi:lysophospholipase L1-like esterase
MKIIVTVRLSALALAIAGGLITGCAAKAPRDSFTGIDRTNAPAAKPTPARPSSSANLDAKRDAASAELFASETNRTLPILFIVGDSTVHNPLHGERGWGDVVGKYFDKEKILVKNHALGGRTSRTFQTQGWWDKILAAARPGDFVLVQMGHNDGGPLDDTNRARGTIRSIGEETKDIYNPIMQKPETVHTYGWYMRKYVSDARAKGMTPIICTPIPHRPKMIVQAGAVENSMYVRFAAAVAESEKAFLVDINRLTLAHYAGMETNDVKSLYFTTKDDTHTSPAGAEVNAQSVVEGLRALTNCPLAGFLLPPVAAGTNEVKLPTP